MNFNLPLESFAPLMILIGLFLGLLGYRFYAVSLFIVGLIVGLVMGEGIAETLGRPEWGLPLGLILGVGVGIIAFFLIRFSFFIAGMAGGIFMARLILSASSVNPNSTEAWFWIIGAALVGGLLTLLIYKPLIMAVTSFLGASLVFSGISGWFSRGTGTWLWILYVALFIVFFVVQYATTRGLAGPMDRSRRYR